MNTSCVRPARSLLEVVVVVVILGALAAVAIPRFSQGAVDDSDTDLRANLAVLRTAIELYYHDHGEYPGQRSAGSSGAGTGTPAAFIRQLTQPTDADGRASPTRSATCCYGPYLRSGIPACRVCAGGPSARVHVIRGTGRPEYDATVAGAGWVYNCDTGYIAANSDGVDSRGMPYNAY